MANPDARVPRLLNATRKSHMQHLGYIEGSLRHYQQEVQSHTRRVWRHTATSASSCRLQEKKPDPLQPVCEKQILPHSHAPHTRRRKLSLGSLPRL